MCFYLWERSSEYQQLDWELWAFMVHTPTCPQLGCPTNQGASYWIDWAHKISYWRDLYSVCVYLYIDICIFIYFPQTGFHPDQPERRTGCVHWPCLCLPKCCLCWPMLPAICMCIYVLYICVPIGNTCSASLLAGPWDTAMAILLLSGFQILQLFSQTKLNITLLKPSDLQFQPLWNQGDMQSWNALLKLHSLHKVLPIKWTLKQRERSLSM